MRFVQHWITQGDFECMESELNPVSHDDLHRLETRVGSRIDGERAERLQSISGIRTEIMGTVHTMHAENSRTLTNISEKVDKLLEFKGYTAGAATVAEKASDRLGRLAGWIVAILLAIATLWVELRR